MSVSAREAAERFSSAAITNSDRYRQGAVGKGSKWKSASARAKTNFVTGMQEALASKSYEKGYDNADANDYDRGVETKGVQNWGTGVQASQDKYEERIAPFERLWGEELPTARGAKRSQANLKRMTENVMRFQKAAE